MGRRRQGETTPDTKSLWGTDMVESKGVDRILPGNLAFHKIRIANTPLTEMHVLPLCHHKKLLPESLSATNFNLNLLRHKRRSDMHSEILTTY